MKTVVRGKKITEICSIIHKCTIHGEKNYINSDFSSPLTRARFEKQLTTLHLVLTFHRFNRCVFILLTKMQTETKTVPSSQYVFNVQGCTHSDVPYIVIGLVREEPAKSCFRDWPFVYFCGGFISHLFGDYTNINMWKSDHTEA